LELGTGIWGKKTRVMGYRAEQDTSYLTLYSAVWI